MRAVITVGLGFGDEGKGATVDFLARELRAEVVVRYSGGAQAGHNVELESGDRHTFSQFGAGTFAGAATFLGRRMILCPSTLVPEADHLGQLGIANPHETLTVHPECLVSTSYHIAMNRLRERARGDDRHGSCGLGIGEARHYWLRYGQDAIVAGDLRDPRRLTAKLTLVRDRFLQEMQELPRLDESLVSEMHETNPAREAGLLQQDTDGISLSHRIPAAKTVLFEGAQGVLLDEWCGFHPYTTWSTVTPHHAWELVDEHGIEDVTVLGLTRAYTTRHGAGPFPTFDAEMTKAINDPGNPENDWQGKIRSGPLDLVLLRYAIEAAGIDGLVVNCLDQVGNEIPICGKYQKVTQFDRPRSQREQEELTKQLESARPVIKTVSREELFDRLSQLAPILIQASGPTADDREIVGDLSGQWSQAT